MEGGVVPAVLTGVSAVLLTLGVLKDSSKGHKLTGLLQMLAIVAAPLLLAATGLTTLPTALWVSAAVGLALTTLMVGADMMSSNGSAFGSFFRVLLAPFALVVIAVYKVGGAFGRLLRGGGARRR